MIKNKGVALILSVIILTAVLAIALTAGKVSFDKIKMSKSSSDSMKAYYAAESGIEYALYQIKQNPSWTPTADCSDPNQWSPVDGAFYCLKQEGQTIKAIGKAGETRRGVEVALAAAGFAVIGQYPCAIGHPRWNDYGATEPATGVDICGNKKETCLDVLLYGSVTNYAWRRQGNCTTAIMTVSPLLTVTSVWSNAWLAGGSGDGDDYPVYACCQ